MSKNSMVHAALQSPQEMYSRDLWQEARAYTRKLQEQEEIAAAKRGRKTLANAIRDALFVLNTVSVPGRPVTQQLTATAIAQRPDVVWFPDFNKYRPRQLKVYQDLGAKAAVFRMGGPTQWVLGDHRWALDATYRPFIEQADQIGMLDQTIGYIVHSPFEPWTPNGATGETLHTELIDEWTSGGYMPAAFCYDHEIALCYRSNGAENWATPNNLVTSLAENTLNTYRKFKRTVSVYSAIWFMKSRDGFWTEHDTWLHNVNKPESMGGAGTQRPLWLAWYAQTMSKSYSSVDQIGADLLTPTPEQVGKYLYAGYEGNAWQFSATVKVPKSMPNGTDDTTGVDFNISLDPARTFYYNFGLKEPGVVTPPPPPPPDGGDLTELLERMGVYETALAELKGRVDAAAAALAVKK